MQIGRGYFVHVCHDVSSEEEACLDDFRHSDAAGCRTVNVKKQANSEMFACTRLGSLADTDSTNIIPGKTEDQRHIEAWRRSPAHR